MVDVTGIECYPNLDACLGSMSATTRRSALRLLLLVLDTRSHRLVRFLSHSRKHVSRASVAGPSRSR